MDESNLKISPKKCQLLRTKIQYMCNTFLSKTKESVLNYQTSLKAIQKLKPPKLAKDCKYCAGVVNYLNMLCTKLKNFSNLYMI